MPLDRRELFAFTAASLLTPWVSTPASATSKLEQEQGMYGLIGKIDVVPGKRDELISILVEGVAGMPGCASYVVAKDSQDPNAIWVTEVWDSQESHQASLGLESVQQAIAKGRPLIAGFSERHETEPIGGHGLVLDAG